MERREFLKWTGAIAAAAAGLPVAEECLSAVEDADAVYLGKATGGYIMHTRLDLALTEVDRSVAYFGEVRRYGFRCNDIEFRFTGRMASPPGTAMRFTRIADVKAWRIPAKEQGRR
jgi:hypothetical protein